MTRGPHVSVIVCTKDRPEHLGRCLKSLEVYMHRDDVEIVVIDNNSSTLGTREVCQQYPITYVFESKPGSGATRNTGARIARGEYIALTDDDMVVEPGWVENLVRNFDDPNVGYVSGRILPVELRTKAQHLFELKGGLSKGVQRRVFDQRFFKRFRFRGVPIYLVAMGGNSMIPKRVWEEVGGHDELFGVGSLVGGGDSHEICYKILRSGYTAIYDPEACARHWHPAQYEDLKNKLFVYGKADTAVQTKFLLRYGDVRSLLEIVLSRNYRQGKRFLQSLTRRSEFPLDLVLSEWIGNWVGPFAYLCALWRSKTKSWLPGDL